MTDGRGSLSGGQLISDTRRIEYINSGVLPGRIMNGWTLCLRDASPTGQFAYCLVTSVPPGEQHRGCCTADRRSCTTTISALSSSRRSSSSSSTRSDASAITSWPVRGLRHSRPPAAARSSTTRIRSDSNSAWLAPVLPRRQESVREDRSALVTHHRSRRRSPARVCAWPSVVRGLLQPGGWRHRSLWHTVSPLHRRHVCS